MREKQIDSVNSRVEIPTLDNALKHITKGGISILLGTAVGGIISFISRITVIRNINESEFGTLSIALVLLSFIVWLFGLGAIGGLSRLIAYYREKDNFPKVETIIRTAIYTSLGIGIVISIAMLLIGSKAFPVFYSPELFPVFSVLIGSVPFLIFTTICIQIFLGFGISTPKIYLDPAGGSIIRLILILIGIFLGKKFSSTIYANIVWAYFLSFALTGLVAMFYATKNLPKLSKFKFVGKIDKELIIFSLPLLGTAIFSLMLGWTDTLFIGYFHSSREVGIYNVAFTLANIIPYLLLIPVSYIYVPIATRYFSNNMLSEVKNLYTSLTRWIFIFTIIPGFVFIMFPAQILSLFFGGKYLSASLPLVLLAVGFLFQTIFGPMAATLIALGKTKIILIINIAGIITNLLLNLIFVPNLGIAGAGYACFFSLILVNILYFVSLYHKNGISPFDKYYLKVILSSIFSGLLVYSFGKRLLDINNWMMPVVVLLFLFIFGILVLIAGAVTENDRMLWRAIKKRVSKIKWNM